MKRTPVEEKLILDFEKNEAFGAVFMNNDDKVVLLPDNKRSEEAEQLISRFEVEHKKKSGPGIYLRLDKKHYNAQERIHFSGYIFDKWTYRPLVIGSILTVDLVDSNGDLVLSKDFDINAGAAYGELDLTNVSSSGNFQLEAYTNVEPKTRHKTNITISPFSTSINHTDKSNYGLRRNIIVPEGGMVLSGVPTKFAYHLTTQNNLADKNLWKIFDENETLIQTIYPNPSGIGTFKLNPKFGTTYTLVNQENEVSLPLPEVISSGMAISIGEERHKSLQISISHRPALPQQVFVLSTFQGHVSSIFKTELSGQKNIIDLPIQYLRNGINTIVVIDKSGEILAQRAVFSNRDKMSIELLSSTWRSRRSNRMEIMLKVTNNNGKPIEANLNAVYTQNSSPVFETGNIRNKVLLGNENWADQVDFEIEGDSLYRAIDNLLILNRWEGENNVPSTKLPQHGNNLTVGEETIAKIDKPLFAEVSVSGSLYSQTTKPRKIKRKKNGMRENEIFWIPKLNIDSKGIAIIELKVSSKNRKLYINIQGLSADGLIGNQTLTLDPSDIIKTDRKNLVR